MDGTRMSDFTDYAIVGGFILTFLAILWSGYKTLYWAHKYDNICEEDKDEENL